MEGRETIAPFVMKTYRMVSDPTTHPLIRWGGASNSFFVPDPLEFSQRVLPVYFKHNNFSSFVRQLNTYGFRKVDPDRWEFANEWFLQGQVHLLKNIVRRKHSRGFSGGPVGFYNPSRVDVDRESWDEEILIEISKLKEEQRSMDVEMRAMCKRLDATEQRPHQMLAFLNNAVDDPELIPRIMSQKDKQHSNQNQLELVSISPDKKRRIFHSATSSSSSSSLATTIKTEDDGDPNPTTLLSPDRTESSSSAWFNNLLGSIHPAARAAGSAVYIGDNSSGRYGEGFGYSHAVNEESNPTPPPYPFALYRGGF